MKGRPVKKVIFAVVILAAAAATILATGHPAGADLASPLALDVHSHGVQAMALSLVNLRSIGHGGVLATGTGKPSRLWHLKTADDAATVEAADYFNAAAALVDVDDVIFASLGVGGTPALKTYRVATNNGSAVTIAAEVGAPVVAATAAKAARRSFAFTMNCADIAAGDLVTAYTPGFAGKILSINAFALKAVTTGSKLATVTPKIGSTNTTGGAVAMTSANMTPQGAKVAGSAITALNVFTATDTIGFVASSVTAFSEGVVLFVVDLENTDLLTALQA